MPPGSTSDSTENTRRSTTVATSAMGHRKVDRLKPLPKKLDAFKQEAVPRDDALDAGKGFENVRATTSPMSDRETTKTKDRESAGQSAAAQNTRGGISAGNQDFHVESLLENLRESGKERWSLPEEMKIRLKSLFDMLDKDKNGVLDSEEKEAMRQGMTGLLIEYGVAAARFSTMPEGITLAEFFEWFQREWEVSSKMQALADLDVVRNVAELLPGGSPELPLGGLVNMEQESIRRMCREQAAAALAAALWKKQADVRQQANRIEGQKGKEVEANNKFAIDGGHIRVAKFGAIDDFHKGIAGQVVFCMFCIVRVPCALQ